MNDVTTSGSEHPYIRLSSPPQSTGRASDLPILSTLIVKSYIKVISLVKPYTQDQWNYQDQ